MRGALRCAALRARPGRDARARAPARRSLARPARRHDRERSAPCRGLARAPRRILGPSGSIRAPRAPRAPYSPARARAALARALLRPLGGAAMGGDRAQRPHPVPQLDRAMGHPRTARWRVIRRPRAARRVLVGRAPRARIRRPASRRGARGEHPCAPRPHPGLARGARARHTDRPLPPNDHRSHRRARAPACARSPPPAGLPQLTTEIRSTGAGRSRIARTRSVSCTGVNGFSSSSIPGSRIPDCTMWLRV